MGVQAVPRYMWGVRPRDAIELVCLGRVPPPLHIVAGRIWTSAPTRQATAAAQLGDLGSPPHVTVVICVRRTHAWFGYVRIGRAGDEEVQSDTPSTHKLLYTTGPLDPAEEGLLWAWGTKSKAAKALRAAAALR